MGFQNKISFVHILLDAFLTCGILLLKNSNLYREKFLLVDLVFCGITDSQSTDPVVFRCTHAGKEQSSFARGCHNKVPQPGDSKNKFIFSTVLEARTLRSRCYWQGRFLWRTWEKRICFRPLPALQIAVFSLCLHIVFTVCLHPNFSFLVMWD